MVEKKANRRTMKILIKEFKADKVKNANVIVDVLLRLESNESGTVTSAITGLHHIFTFLLNEDSIQKPAHVPGVVECASDKFTRWLCDRYEETLKKLLGLLTHHEHSVQELALCCLVKLMQCEGRHPVRKVPQGSYPFPEHRLKPLVTALVSDTVDTAPLITLLLEYLECQDFMFYTLVTLSTIVKAHKDQNKTEVYMNNLFLFLEQMDIPPEETKALVHPKLLLDLDSGGGEEVEGEEEPAFTLPYQRARKALNTIWGEVLGYPLTPALYRRCLILLPEKVMQHLDRPLKLTDFFMESYNMGGGISLLALQGVFILMHKHNLDYPEFYKKLYALLEPSVFQAKYKARFFMLMDKFLSSSHLPEYVIAAYVKRLGRLSLVAPSSSSVLLLKFIVNLLVRYPGLQKMVHNPSAHTLENDPFIAEEPDPAKCHACESSLWEVASLQHHALPYVSKVAGFTHKNLPTLEHDISEFVETTYQDIFQRASKLTVHETVPVTFQKPQGLFQFPDDQMSSSWNVL